LNSLFGTSTTSDIHLLHDVLNELQFQNSDISHSLANQFTYVKKLNTAVKKDTEAIANLSNTGWCIKISNVSKRYKI